MTFKYMIKSGLTITTLALLTGCQKPVSSTPSQAMPEKEAPAPLTDRWLGHWNGPEGTFLELSKNGDKYLVKIQSLDGPNAYEGWPAGDRIKFERNGKSESIHAGNGRDTGMKWLLDKKNCLVIETGEGFCRD